MFLIHDLNFLGIETKNDLLILFQGSFDRGDSDAEDYLSKC